MSIIEQALPRWEELQPEQRAAGPRKVSGSRSFVSSPGSLQPARELALDLERLNALGIVTPTSHDIHRLEQYRVIKRSLLKTLPKRERRRSGDAGVAENNARFVLVTSALPGEGKTFTAVNLAISMAMERDTRIVLVDADLKKRDASRTFGVESAVGLTDFLSDAEIPLAQVLFKTNLTNLVVLPAGTEHGHHAELISSREMEYVISSLCLAYSVVIADSPPLLFSSDATTLAGLAGQVVMVVEAGQTPEAAVQEAVQLIGPSKPIGFVLNKDVSGIRARKRYYRRTK